MHVARQCLEVRCTRLTPQILEAVDVRCCTHNRNKSSPNCYALNFSITRIPSPRTTFSAAVSRTQPLHPHHGPQRLHDPVPAHQVAQARCVSGHRPQEPHSQRQGQDHPDHRRYRRFRRRKAVRCRSREMDADANG